MRESHTHRRTQRIREQSRASAHLWFELRLALAEGLQDRNQEERIAFGFTMQAFGQPRRAEV
jgi:hypothetical protein